MRNRMIWIFLFLLTLTCSVSSAAQEKQDQVLTTKRIPAQSCENAIKEVSIIQLIASPEAHHGKCIRVIGFVRLEFEGTALYLHEVDYNNGITKNGIWLHVSDNFDKKSNQMYVLVEGMFDATNHGHMGLFSGSIKNIKRFQPWTVKRSVY